MPPAAYANPDTEVDFGRLMRSIGENWHFVLVAALVMTALALLVSAQISPRYYAESRILIEPSESAFTRPESSVGTIPPILDEVGVASQVEIITSADLLKSVAEQLKLAEHPEFAELAQPSRLGRLAIFLGLRPDTGVVPPEERILGAMRERLDVYMVRNSRVIGIGFSSHDPTLSASIPRALTDAYLGLQRDAKRSSTSAATEWLEQEIEDLRVRVREAEARTERFRAETDLLLGQNNEPLAIQQLAEISSELSRIRAARSSAEARQTSIRQALEQGGAVGSLPEVLASPLVQRLRERQIELEAELADQLTTLLDNHPRIRSLRSQIAGLERQIDGEVQKLLQGLQTEAATARMREQELNGELNELKAQSSRLAEQQVELRALEREAAAQRDLLESYLTRHREASARRDRNYLPADARIFAEAVVPSRPYFPKPLPIAAAAFLGTLLLAGIVILLRELFSGRAFHPVMPEWSGIAQVTMPAPPPSPPAVSGPQAQAVATAKPAAGEPAAADMPAVPDRQATPMDGVLGIRAAADKLVASGVTSALFLSPEEEAASSVSILVAREIADSGLRVLLLDLTAAGTASRPMLDGLRLPGITNLLLDEAQFIDIIHSDRYSECDIIPVGTADPVEAMQWADRLPIIMNSLTTAYDLVIVECGPAYADSILRFMPPEATILVSAVDPDSSEVEAARADLHAHGFEHALTVSAIRAIPGKVETTLPPDIA